MKVLSFFKIDYSTKKEVIGSDFPQICDYKEDNNQKSQFSIDDFCEFKGKYCDELPILDNYILSNRAKLTDLLSCGLCPGGDILISERFKDLLFGYNLGPCQIFPATVETKKKEKMKYFLIHFNYSLEKYIDFKNTKYNYSVFPELLTSPIVDFESYDAFRMKNRKLGVLEAKELFLKKEFDLSLDLFSISWIEQSVLISEKLKNDLCFNKITGLEFLEKQIFIKH